MSQLNIKGILINASTGLVSEVVVQSYEDISRLLGVDIFTTVRLTRDEVLFVDDEGLINGTANGFTCGVTEHGYLAGNGLILGVRGDGESISTRLTANDLSEFGITHALPLRKGVARSDFTKLHTKASLN